MSGSKTYDFFRKADVHDIKNPAYVVANKNKHVVAWNEEFERLTNFSPYDIAPPKECYQLFEGVWEKKEFLQICSVNCTIRTLESGRAGVIRNLWINSRDNRDQSIKRKVDVYIFLFEENQEKFTLHILSDKGEVHSNSYFKVLSYPVNIGTGINVLNDVVEEVKENDVHRIQNPAYVVKEITEENVKKLKEKVENLKRIDNSFKKEVNAEAGSGCVVAWNKEFGVLTNLTPEDIDWNTCENLIGGMREVGWEKICQKNCPIRKQPGQVVLVPVIRDFWISSKDRREREIKRKTDVCIFPFKKGENKYTLHILFDKGISYNEDYFEQYSSKG